MTLGELLDGMSRLRKALIEMEVDEQKVNEIVKKTYKELLENENTNKIL